ncbi:MAG: translocation/assembly module TamB domain-containing protein [Bacteroidaceae bacterium]|nr:translocation/assembly module TamB domain-containing protein [Bacteroidaceae bacterium]
MKKALKWTCGIVLTPVVAVLLLALLLYVPPVQRRVVQWAAGYASRQTGLDISVGTLRITPLLDLDLQGLTVVDPPDTLICVERAVADLDLSHILSRRIGLDALDLEGGRLNLTLKSSDDGDSTSGSLPRLLMNVNRIRIARSRVSIELPADSIMVDGLINEAVLEGGEVDLAAGHYAAKLFALDAQTLEYRRNDDTGEAGFDYLAFRNIGVELEDFSFDQETGELRGNLTRGALEEERGLAVRALSGQFLLNGTGIRLRKFQMETPHSHAEGDADLEWNALKSKAQEGTMNANLQASLGHEDVTCLFDRYLGQRIADFYPQKPIDLALDVKGNVDSLTIGQCHLSMPGVLDARGTGWVTDVMDSVQRQADLMWDAKTMDLTFVKRMADMKDVNLPPMVLNARTQLKGQRYEADALLTEGRGRARLRGVLDAATMSYKAQARLQSLNVHHFLPMDSLYELTATAHIEGRGTDYLSKATRLKAEAQVEHLRYGQWDLDSLRAAALLHHGTAELNVESDNRLLGMNGCVNATIDRTVSNARFSLDMNHIDLYALGLVPKPLRMSMVMNVEGESDLRNVHRLSGNIQAMELVLSDTVVHPLDMKLEALLRPDTLFASAEAGDMTLRMQAQGGLERLRAQAEAFGSELNRQLKAYHLDQDTLRTLLPTLSVQLHSGHNNPICNFLRPLGYTYEALHLDLASNPTEGLNGSGRLNTLNTGAVLLDTIQLRIYQDSTGVSMDGRVRNGPRNKVVCFESTVHADLTPTGAAASLIFRDAKGKKGVDIGMQADMREDGMTLHFTPLNPVIAYRNFTLNADNFVTLTSEHRIEALVDLLADDGTGLKLYSTPNEEALQDLSLSVNHFNVGELAQVLPYMPDLGGLLHGDIHGMQSDSITLSVSTDMTVENMMYNGKSLGNIGVNAVYLPNSDGTHYVDGIITENGNEVVLLNGMYRQEKGQGMIEATAQLQELPMSLANVFIPSDVARLEGFAGGELAVTGPTASPLLSGRIGTKSVRFVAEPYNINLRFPDDSIRITRSRIDLDRIEAYAVGNNPMVLDGTIDFSNLDRISMSMGVNARNYKLIDAPRSRDALAYGKVFVDLSGMLRGTLDNLSLRGKLTVLGSTDVTYVMKDSPITVEDQLADLVTFVDFSDTLGVEAPAAKQQFMEMQFMVSIEQAANVHCLLSESGNDYINLEGGGDLTLTYDNQEGMKLSGRYTILNGEMKYTVMPVIGSKHFKIKPASYVEFQGNMMNPTLNVSATERVKATMNEGGASRSVAFDVGLHISQTLENMGLEFTLDAPEDLTAQNELAGMGQEERGRVAVTMLATGMYLTDLSSAGGFSTTNTLNSYLQSEINQLVGMAQSTIDMNFGIENSTTETGSTSTDYSFSFAKRFWGNRITLTIGGKVRSGSDAVNTGQSIIDNVALEYRLDQSATRYVKVYYDRNYESLLEGELTEMGAGVVFRRKTDRLGELFIFRKKKQAEPPRTEKPDGPGPKDNGQQSTADEPQSTEKPDGPEPKTNSPEPTAAGPQSTETKDNSQQTTDNGEENIEEE